MVSSRADFMASSRSAVYWAVWPISASRTSALGGMPRAVPAVSGCEAEPSLGLVHGRSQEWYWYSGWRRSSASKAVVMFTSGLTAKTDGCPGQAPVKVRKRPSSYIDLQLLPGSFGPSLPQIPWAKADAGASVSRKDASVGCEGCHCTGMRAPSHLRTKVSGVRDCGRCTSPHGCLCGR